jgi:hypothetical protein
VCFLLIVYVIPNGVTGLIEDALHRRDGSAKGPLQRAFAPLKNLLQRKSDHA